MTFTTITPAIVAAAARAASPTLALTRELDSARATIDRLHAELREADRHLRASRADLARAESRTARLETARRTARSVSPTTPVAAASARRERWATDQQWVQHEVYLAWVERYNATDRDEWPIREYSVGDGFAASLAALDACQFVKAMRAVVDVVTHRISQVSSRQPHLLRDGARGPSRERRSDGARCWRAYIEQHAPSARRLHYWTLPGGLVELSRVVLHDDVKP